MPWSIQHRGDFLTVPFKGSVSGYWSGYIYFRASANVRKQYRDAIKSRGYTRIYFDLFGAWGPKEDYFAAPTKLVPFLKEAAEDGLGPVLWLGPEDDEAAQQKYAGTKFDKQLAKFVPVVDEWVAEYILGVEVEEYWSDAEVSRIGAALRKLTKKPIWVHRKTGLHGPWSWWKAQKWATGLAYQYNKRDMKKPGFLAHPDDVAEETKLYAGRLKQVGKKLLASEYAWMRPEDKARELGKVAMQNGAVGFSNGGK